MSQIVIVGCGNMGSAILRGVTRRGVTVFAIDSNRQVIEKMREIENVEVVESLEKVEAPRTIIVAVKPNQIEELLRSMRGDFENRDTIVSIAAGVETKKIEKYAKAKKEKLRVVRAMPNLPVAVGKGMTALYSEDEIPEEVLEVFSGCGETVILQKEHDFHAFTALAGSMPAFVFVALEALADGAVKLGMTREQAKKIAVQTVLGAAEYAKETELHSAELKDRVASPGGTTIEGLAALERGNFRHTLIDAIEATGRRSEEMEKG